MLPLSPLTRIAERVFKPRGYSSVIPIEHDVKLPRCFRNVGPLPLLAASKSFRQRDPKQGALVEVSNEKRRIHERHEM